MFEYCILDRFNSYLRSSDIQFDLKKNSDCRNAIYTARTIVERLNKNGSTANKNVPLISRKRLIK